MDGKGEVPTPATCSGDFLAAIEGVSPEQYQGVLNLVKLFKDATDLLTDEAFAELFISAQGETSSGSAPENTEAPSA